MPSYAPSRSSISSMSVFTSPPILKRARWKDRLKSLQPISQRGTSLWTPSISTFETSPATYALIIGMFPTDSFIYFEEPLATDQEVTLKSSIMPSRRRACIFAPLHGLQGRRGASLYPRRTQGSSPLVPCFDAPNEKFTSEIICLLPEGMGRFPMAASSNPARCRNQAHKLHLAAGQNHTSTT